MLIVDDIADIHIHLVQLQVVMRHPRQIQQIVDESPQVFGLSDGRQERGGTERR